MSGDEEPKAAIRPTPPDFLPGQRVRCINATSSPLVEGQIYTLVGYPSHGLCEVKEVPTYTFRTDRFLLSRLEPKFIVGDTVEVRQDESLPHLRAGNRYVVRAIRPINSEDSPNQDVKLGGIDEWFRSSRFHFVPTHTPGGPGPAAEPVTLDPSDPFDATLIKIVLTNRAKRQDYTSQGSSAWENFDVTEARLARRYGLTADQVRGMAVDAMIFTKDTRLDAIVSRGGVAVNESAEDSFMDIAVYTVIRWARALYPNGKAL